MPALKVALAPRARGQIAVALLGLAAVVPPALAVAHGEDGVQVRIPISGISDVAQAVVVDPGGKIVLAGSVNSNGSAGGAYSVLARVTPSGALDSTFGGIGGYLDPTFGSIDRFFGVGGKRMIDISAFADVVYGLASDLSGARFWAVGTAYGSLTTAQDFLAVEFGLPATIFRHGFETATAP